MIENKYNIIYYAIALQDVLTISVVGINTYIDVYLGILTNLYDWIIF